VTSKTRASAKSKLRKEDYTQLAEFRYLLRRFLDFSENEAAQAGVTAQQHQALLAIKGFAAREHATTGELAERLRIRHHSAVGLIDRLAAKNLVHRRTGANDRRRVLIELTPTAEALLASLSVAHHEELRRLSPLLRVLLADFEAGSLKNGRR
jgi:DNA-binding MarR family transcriptional regulator